MNAHSIGLGFEIKKLSFMNTLASGASTRNGQSYRLRGLIEDRHKMIVKQTVETKTQGLPRLNLLGLLPWTTLCQQIYIRTRALPLQLH